MIEIFGNNAATTLAAGIGTGSVSVTLLAGTGANFPNPAAGQFFRMTFTDALTGTVREVVYVTARSGDVCTITRAQEGTSPLSWLAGDAADNLNTAGSMTNMGQQIQVQQNLFNYSTDSGAANAYVLTLTPNNLSTPVPGAIIYFLAANPNTGPSTVRVNGGSTYPILGQARLALQGNEINKFTALTFDVPTASYVVLYSTGGVPQAPTTTKTNQVLTYGSAIAFFAKINGDATQPFAASQINTSAISSPSGNVFLEASNYTASVNLTNTAYIKHRGAPGTVGTTSSDFVTGAQLQNVYKVGEVKMWWGQVANIAAVWGPGWQLANGTNGSPNMLDRMPIAAGSSYAVGAVGGATGLVLSQAQMPAHNHPINDPTHAHSVYDPSHNHGISQSPHGHGFSDPGHAHGFTVIAQAGTDSGVGALVGGGNVGGQDGSYSGVTAASQTGAWVDAQYANVSNNAATTGIGIYAAGTGISTAVVGSSSFVPTMPPYIGILFIYYSGIGA